MNRLTFIPLILLLSACASAQSTPVITPTGTSVAPNITPSATPTPRPSETPTATEDPNRPPDATGQDKDGYYKEIDGVKYYQALDSNGEVLVDGWFKSGIKNPTLNGGIQLGDRDTKTVSMRFSVKEGMTGVPFLSHTNGDPESLFSKMFYTKLRGRVQAEMAQFYEDVDAGRISIPVVDAQGNPPFELAMNDKTVVNIFLAEQGDFVPDFEAAHIQSKTTYDSEGNINITVASNITAQG